jgi:hypothetical protein
MSSEQGDFFLDSGGASGSDALVEFDWDDGLATNLLQDDCLSSTRRMDVGADCDNHDDDSEDVVDCVVETMLNMVHLEATAGGGAAVVSEGQNDSAPEGQEDASIKKRRGPKKVAMWTDEDGSKRPCLPRQTFWYSQYVLHPDLGDPHFHKIFRLRFRLPYEQFVQLHQRLESEPSFARWHAGKVNPWSRIETTPISLLLLTSLRYLGRGWTFDDLSENTSISQETIRVFFHSFIAFGSTVLYTEYIRPPTTCDEARHHTSEYSMAGFPGAIGSTDATHIMLERVQYRLRQTHIGFKMSHTARTYNITVNHRRQILATTAGHPARWNDKTLALFDTFMTDLKDGHIMNDMFFNLYEENGGNTTQQNPTVVTRTYQGAWLLVDNGYLAWPTTVPPIKTTSSRIEIRFSGWLESMRKDVECTFGILKGRWRILKTGIRLSGVDSADKIFLTCCALHNWLLETDGFTNNWNNGIPASDPSVPSSDWDGPLGEHDPDDFAVIPRAIMNLHNPVAMRSYDLSGMGPGADTVLAADTNNSNVSEDIPLDEAHNNNSTSNSGATLVRSLSLAEFRRRLIIHFAIAYRRREIRWPTVPKHLTTSRRETTTTTAALDCE